MMWIVALLVVIDTLEKQAKRRAIKNAISLHLDD